MGLWVEGSSEVASGGKHCDKVREVGLPASGRETG